jgi:hypothetical protein
MLERQQNKLTIVTFASESCTLTVSLFFWGWGDVCSL